MQNEKEKINELLNLCKDIKKECEEILSSLPENDDTSEEIEFDPDASNDVQAYDHYINDYDEDVVLLWLLLRSYNDEYDIDDISLASYSNAYVFDVADRQYYFGNYDQMYSLALDQCRDLFIEMCNLDSNDFLYNYVDFDQAASDAVDTDGIAHTLASYDGDELSYMFERDGHYYYAYRIN
jgi:hypothetical protein